MRRVDAGPTPNAGSASLTPQRLRAARSVEASCHFLESGAGDRAELIQALGRHAGHGHAQALLGTIDGQRPPEAVVPPAARSPGFNAHGIVTLRVHAGDAQYRVQRLLLVEDSPREQ